MLFFVRMVVVFWMSSSLIKCNCIALLIRRRFFFEVWCNVSVITNKSNEFRRITANKSGYDMNSYTAG